MSLSEGHSNNFQTMLRAAANGDLALMACTEKATGSPAAVVCMVERDGERVSFVPVARLFDENPYDLLNPPEEPDTPRGRRAKRKKEAKPVKFPTITDLPAKKPRTRKEMIAFLADHFRYYTMSSVNRSQSYAVKVKVGGLNLPKGVRDACYEALDINGCWDMSGYNAVLREFDERHSHAYQIGTNGRSGGYLVLYQGGTESSGHRSHCTECGQQNFKSVVKLTDSPEDQVRKYILTHYVLAPGQYPDKPEIAATGVPADRVMALVSEMIVKYRDKNDWWVTFDDRCGRCGEHARVNYEKSPRRTFTKPGLGMDDDGDSFEEWDTDSLRDRIELVWDFAQTCEAACQAFANWAMRHKPVEETVLVEKKVTVAGLRDGGDDE